MSTAKATAEPTAVRNAGLVFRMTSGAFELRSCDEDFRQDEMIHSTAEILRWDAVGVGYKQIAIWDWRYHRFMLVINNDYWPTADDTNRITHLARMGERILPHMDVKDAESASCY